MALGSPPAPKEAPTFPEALKSFLAAGKWRPRTKIVMESIRHFSWTRAIDKITENALAAIEAPSARAHTLKDLARSSTGQYRLSQILALPGNEN